MIDIKSIENVTNKETGCFVSKLNEDDYLLLKNLISVISRICLKKII